MKARNLLPCLHGSVIGISVLLDLPRFIEIIGNLYYGTFWAGKNQTSACPGGFSSQSGICRFAGWLTALCFAGLSPSRGESDLALSAHIRHCCKMRLIVTL